jgi:hypothetical protein
MLIHLPTNLRLLIHGGASLQVLTRGQTLPSPSLLDHCQLELRPTTAPMSRSFSRHRHLRPRILPRQGLTRVDSPIQSP